MEKKIYSFGWGVPVAVQEALLLTTKRCGKWGGEFLQDMVYADERGMPELISLVKELVEYLTGTHYEYITITSGATQALKVTIQVASVGLNLIQIPKYRYPYLKDIVDSAERIVRTEGDLYFPDSVMERMLRIVESPNNPTGALSTINTENVIWDAVYHSAIFMPREIFNARSNQPQNPRIVLGSLGKYLGIPGLKLGWIATNDKLLDWSINNQLRFQQASCSVPSQNIAIDILKVLMDNKIEKFEDLAATKINMNRELVGKLEYLFDEKVKKTGMFFMGNSNTKVAKILDKAGVLCTEGFNCGHPVIGEKVRINLARSNNETEEMVKSVLKVDRRKT